MNILEKKFEQQLQLLIEANKSFAIYKLSNTQSINFVAQITNSPSSVKCFTDLKDKKGFIICPFNRTDHNPIFIIEPEIEIEGISSIVNNLSNLFPEAVIAEKNHIAHSNDITDISNASDEYDLYIANCNKFIQPLIKGELRKLVLSRSHSIPLPSNFSPLQSFMKATKTYPRMMNYVFYTPQTGMWMGNTPEIILSGQDKLWSTVAIAGTKSLQSVTNNSTDWDAKNIEEQNIVAQYIRNTIAPYAKETEENGPYTAQAGNVVHLKTEFNFSLINNLEVGELLKKLHPTPAVCGYPKEKAFDFIMRNEGYNREYYSGIIGILDPEHKTDLYVNLRCAKIDKKRITLYAGGGIMPHSKPEQEWNETQIKMQTLLNVL
ncbi:isochorismate synthase [Dysgonomonas massiliensis]|uniref:isochorismate synthase n=1 Tax=Dysgonomonas massiliensis TaxID=2040292 RepID=UPI000C781DF3|nr:isochorismate synthase [Dysgonomonas massiliensis]